MIFGLLEQSVTRAYAGEEQSQVEWYMSTLSLGASGHDEGGVVNSTAEGRTRPDCIRAAAPDNCTCPGAAPSAALAGALEA